MAKLSASFAVTLEDGSHVINVNVNMITNPGGGRTFQLIISVDNVQVVDRKAAGPGLINGSNSFKIGNRIGKLEISNLRYGFGVQGGDYKLTIDGKNIPEGQHVTLANPVAAVPKISNPPPSSQPQVVVNVQPNTNAAVVPTLPPNCPSCGTAITMNNAKWSGPMSAACPVCNTGIQVSWTKIGG